MGEKAGTCKAANLLRACVVSFSTDVQSLANRHIPESGIAAQDSTPVVVCYLKGPYFKSLGMCGHVVLVAVL